MMAGAGAFQLQVSRTPWIEHSHRPWPPPASAKASLILHECDSYIAINKPADFHMDGDKPQTVHKLLNYYYPTPSLIERVKFHHSIHGDKDKWESHLKEDGLTRCRLCINKLRKENARKFQEGWDALIVGELNKLTKFNDLTDNELRPCHQLDYATSGVLLIARSRSAAAAACRAFSERRAIKQYVALLSGHVRFSDNCSTCDANVERGSHMPIISQEKIAAWENGSLEKRYRTMKENKGKKTFAGYMPTHSVFTKWKASAEKQVECMESMSDRSLSSVAVPEMIVRLEGGSGAFVTSPRLTSVQVKELLDSKWSIVRKDKGMKHMFEDLADRYNSALAQGGSVPLSRKENKHRLVVVQSYRGTVGVDNLSRKPLEEQAHVFCSEIEVIGNDIDRETSCYISASIAELDDDFKMMVENGSLADNLHRDYYTSFLGTRNISSLDFKPALTKCHLLARGTLLGNPVTKVLFQPKTGRRHQLRMHAVVLGYPIVGDTTYEFPGSVDICDRMCLHAKSLSLELIGEASLSFEAPDPFIASNGAEFQVSSIEWW